MQEMSDTKVFNFDFDNVALNPKFRKQEAALLNALLQSSDYGVLVSGLDREDIVANRRLGELFEVSPLQVVQTDPDAVRALALSRVRDPNTFEEVLRNVYADPLLTYEDDLELIGDPPRTLRRFTAPILGPDNQPLARLWTFLDITETRQLQSQVQTQLDTRTLDYNTTAEILRVMNVLCSIHMQHISSDTLMSAIVQQTRHLGGADCAAMLLLRDEPDHEPDNINLNGAICAPGKASVPFRYTLHQDKLLADLLSRVESLAYSDAEFNQLILCPHYDGSLSRHLEWQSLALVPLCQHGVLKGVFLLGLPAVFNGSTHHFSELNSSELNSSDLNSSEYTSRHDHDSADQAAREQPIASPVTHLPGTQPALAVLRHLGAIADQIMLTLQAHRLQSELHATLATLQTTQHRMVEIEKLRTAGTLAASIAHDIRNIMTAVQIEMEMSSLPEVTQSSLWEHMNRFSTLTHRLLAFARPGALEMRPHNVGEILQRVLVLIAGQAAIHNVQLELELQDSLPAISADATQLEHLFVNLCLNGIQAMTDQGGVLSIVGAATPEEFQIEVSDTGSGIAPDIIEHIFEPFFTTRNTGTGLGLFSCKRIVEEHGGRLKVTSYLDKGTTFTVKLPRGYEN